MRRRTEAGAATVRAGDAIAARLRRQIVLGELPEGALLPTESELMARFAVSRPTLREAFRVLESESIITITRGAHGGARATAPNRAVLARHTGLLLQYRGARLADVYQARAILEVDAVGLAATRADPAQLAELRDLAAGGHTLVSDGDRYAEHDCAFHLALVRLSGNQTLTVLVGALLGIMAEHNRRFVACADPGTTRPSALVAQSAHQKLIALLEERDAAAAASFWRGHLDQVTAYMAPDPATTVVEILS